LTFPVLWLWFINYLTWRFIVKRILAGMLLMAVGLSLACGGGRKADTLAGEYFIKKVEDAIEDTGPFDVEGRLAKKGGAYNIKVDLKSTSRKDFYWNSLSSEEKFGYFMGVCAGAVGALAIDAPEELELKDLHIGYENEVWAVPVDFCTYLAAASFTGAMTEEEMATELFRELERVK
jgi:hypothetical protein